MSCVSLFSFFSSPLVLFSLFFFNDTPTTEIYTLSLHDALPIRALRRLDPPPRVEVLVPDFRGRFDSLRRSEEHTSELQSRQYLVCRLLLEKKKKKNKRTKKKRKTKDTNTQ